MRLGYLVPVAGRWFIIPPPPLTSRDIACIEWNRHKNSKTELLYFVIKNTLINVLIISQDVPFVE